MLRQALSGGGDPWLVYGDLDKDKHGRDVKFLDQYAQERWDCVLHYMVGSEVCRFLETERTTRVLIEFSVIDFMNNCRNIMSSTLTD